ncbi:52 kDa repressor of the inhibitor of the protein kinase-like [Xyrauchen texanus]|uniref:52 kDa repressor of the inhibitor of the protein kinase-like n=1 Tax=Xyrauchen texanus TaxID=154827 RepID=UPI002242A283|nr:52 kDa repressor of the inhibitor of the protein kinase-like [Xyrauchen texanus]
MPDCCAAANCKPSTDQSNVSFFRFPLDPDRCKQWVGNCRRPDLESKTPAFLHSHYKLCSKHFETTVICQQSDLKSALKDDAVPTIFDFTIIQEMAQNSSRKRTIETTGEEPVVTKKTKGTTDNSKLSEITSEVVSDPGENIETQNPPVHDESEKEDPAISKAKETLKDYFKETLALTGFSICNNVTLTPAKPLGKDPAGPLSANAICAEKIDRKEVLTLGEDVMREEIRNGLRLARFFSILLEDKINIEGKDQIPVFVRSMTGVGFPQKHLMGFLPCDIDSDSLFLMLISEIRNKWGLRMEHCRGFTYLSTGRMCLKLKELACRMLQDFPQVVLSPCEPYAFNVWLIRSIPILSIQEVVNTVEEVAAIIRQSETLAKKLDAKITALYGHIKGEVDRVKDACQNHWEYGTDAFQIMLEILEPVLNSIGEMCTSALSDLDADTVEALLKLREKLKNFNFIITLVVLKSTLCCVSILNPSLRGIISVSSTLQYTISNALKLLTKHMQEIAIFHRKWFSDAVGRAKKLGVPVIVPVELVTNGECAENTQTSLEDYYRETLSKKVLQYLVDEVKRVLGPEMIRILRWLSLVPSYMADHNFSIRKDKVADANLNNLARPDSFYDELGCWEVKWRHASKRRILPTNVNATLKIPDIGFYPNIQSLLRVLGTIPCIKAEADVYGQYEMVLDRYRSYMKEVPVEKRLSNLAFVYVNQDVHFSIEEMVEAYIKKYPEILEQLHEDEAMEVQPSVPETSANDIAEEGMEEPREMTLNMEVERQKLPECSETDKEALKSALKAAVTAAFSRQSRQSHGDQDQEVEYVTKSEMTEVLKVCEDVVRERILSEVGNSFFSLFIDRVVRLGETDYLPMFLRFVDSFDVMRLELMGFAAVTFDTEAMCEQLFDVITKEWHLDLSYCRGQAYLGSGEVSYKLKAFACKIQETYPLAICTHFSCYSFNTWWSRSVPVTTIIRAIDTLEEIVSYFRSTAALEKQLDQVLAIGLRESYEKIHELQGKFCSSWLENHDSYEVFGQILEPLAECLENIYNGTQQKWSLAVSNRAKRLLQLIRDFDFIVAIVALKNASSFTRELSAALQKDHFSAASQLSQISGIVATLNRVKTNIKVFHQNWFDEACAFAQNLGVQVKVPDSVTVPRDSLLKPVTFQIPTTSSLSSVAGKLSGKQK